MLPDRLLHGCHIVKLPGSNYRMRRQMELSKAVRPTASTASDDGSARRKEEL